MTGMTIPQRSSKARGAFFTPPQIADFIANWAVRSAEDLILEPSCGDAEFLIAAGKRQTGLGAGLFLGEALTGIEVHQETAISARTRLNSHGCHAATVINDDFFDVDCSPIYDAIIGNPPFIRYQDFAGDARRKAAAAALRQGVRLTGLASSWAAFVLHACGFLSPGGRLALVLPAELLGVQYASDVRRFLLDRFRCVKLVLFEELVFPGVQEEVVLLLAEGEGSTSNFEVFQARNLENLTTWDNLNWTTFAPNGDEKWTPALLDPVQIAAYQSVQDSLFFEALGEWGQPYLGAVTGNNTFFTFSNEQIKQLGIPKKELLRISPPGSRHLRSLIFSLAAWAELGAEGKRCYLFYPRSKVLSKAAQDYIADGERRGIHEAYKCANRRPWWRVPLVPISDLLLTYMDRDNPRLITNRAAVHHLNSLYGIAIRDGRKTIARDLLPMAFLNSITLLSAEIVGRAYGGGLLKLEPTEAERLLVPSHSVILRCERTLRSLRPQLSVALRSGNLSRIVRLVDRELLVRGMKTDSDHLTILREARSTLQDRRYARSERTNAPRA